MALPVGQSDNQPGSEAAATAEIDGPGLLDGDAEIEAGLAALADTTPDIGGEEADSGELEAETPAVVETPVHQAFEPVSDLDAVDIATWGLPAEALPRVQQLLDFSRAQAAAGAVIAADGETAKVAFQAAEKELREVVEALRDGGPEAKEVLDKITEKNAVIEELNRHVVEVGWEGFRMKHPDYQASVPQATKDAFAKLIESGDYLGDGFGGPRANYLTKLEEAFQFAAYRTGYLGASPGAGKQKQPAATAVASRQAVVGSEELPPSEPHRDVLGMSYEELMDKNDHLL